LRVLLDTNVLVAAFGTRGLCADLLREMILMRHDLLTCLEVEEELERVLRTKLGTPPEVAGEALHVLRQSATRISSSPLRRLALRHSADVAIVSAAINGGAEALVTGDREILELRSVEGLLMLSPRAFWDTLREPGTE